MTLKSILITKFLLMLPVSYLQAQTPIKNKMSKNSKYLAMNFDKAILIIKDDKSGKRRRRRVLQKCSSCPRSKKVWCAGGGGFCGDCSRSALQRRRGSGSFYCGQTNNKRRSKKCSYRNDREFFNKRCRNNRR